MTPTLAKFLFLIAITLAPAGTHHITVTAASESYTWTSDTGSVWDYHSSNLSPYSTPEQALVKNQLPDGTNIHEGSPELHKIGKHNWITGPVYKFDDSHQLEKGPGGYVYSVNIGDPSQKIYSIIYKP